MATRSTTTKKTETESTPEISAVPVVDQEKENMKKELEDLKAQIALMAKMISESKPAEATTEKKPERYINFISMAPGVTYLRGTSMYKIEGQFTSRPFLEREARLIVNNMPKTIRQGIVYIADADFVKECDLEDTYRTLLSNKDLESLLKKDPNTVVEIYKNASKGQQNIIIDMIVDKKLNAERIDANILLDLQSLSGRNLVDIEPLEKEG